MITGQDSNINNLTNDSLFVPLYLNKNTFQTDYVSGDNIGATDYIVSTLQDSFPLQKKSLSIFTEKSPVIHKNLSLNPKEKESSNLWVFGIFLVVGTILALLMRLARANMTEFLSGCFSKNQVSLSTKDGERIHSLVLIPVIFVFFPMLSLLILSLFKYFEYTPTLYNYQINGYILFFAVYVLCLVIYFTKIAFIKFFGWMFKSKKISNYYIQIQYNFNFLMGILLFLPIFCLEYIDIYYKEIFIFISLFILVILIVTRLIRNFYVIINSLKFSHFYLFFYLCTLELLPLLLISKFLFF